MLVWLWPKAEIKGSWSGVGVTLFYFPQVFHCQRGWADLFSYSKQVHCLCSFPQLLFHLTGKACAGKALSQKNLFSLTLVPVSYLFIRAPSVNM